VRLAALADVDKHALHAILMKPGVTAKTHDVSQQTGLLDLRAKVTDLHTGPIGLAGNRAIAFEQPAGQHLGHRLFIHRR